ncbi:YdcF family protein [Streptomyces sp. NPDC048111]|uniref:YdcF family protein n=1 Tax=Streptomyces sp. NPDC048111 TaxID=3365500 RepID=UPI003718561A
MRRGTGLVVAAVGVLGWGEWLNWRWSRSLLGRGQGPCEVVVVLGYRNPQPTANLINRWRVRAGIRSVSAGRAGTTRVVFSGGAVGGGAAEARLMADHARTVLRFAGPVVLEDRSTTTWENIANIVPLIEDADRIKIVSQPAHALKARAYLRRRRPDLARRLVRAGDYRPGEWILAKPVLALYGLWTLRGLDPAERGGPGWPEFSGVEVSGAPAGARPAGARRGRPER